MEQMTANDRDLLALCREERDRLEREHRNLKLLVAAIIVELGGVYEVPNATLTSVDGTLHVEQLPERGTVRVRAE